MHGEALMAHRTSWPAGWRRVMLADIGKWLSGGTPSTSNDAYWNGHIPWISAASLKTFRVAESDRNLTALGAKNGSRLVGAGTVLFVVRGMSLKSEFRIGVTQRTVAFGQDCKAVLPAEGIDPYFLAYAIQSKTPEILAMVEETSHGTGRLDTLRLQELEIGVPPLLEQRRIVAAHEAIERRIAALESVMTKLEVAQEANLADAISAAARQAFVPLNNVLRQIETGWSPVCDARGPAVDEWGVLKLSAITSGVYVPTQAKALPRGVEPRTRFEVRPGDVLMSRANGVKALVGVATTVVASRPKLLIPDLMFRLVSDLDVLSPEFLGVALAAQPVRRQIDDAMRGTSGQYKISKADVAGLLVPRVPLHMQNQIVAARNVFSHRISAIRKMTAKLRLVQRGSTEDLLAGRAQAGVG